MLLKGSNNMNWISRIGIVRGMYTGVICKTFFELVEWLQLYDLKKVEFPSIQSDKGEINMDGY